MKQKNSGLAGVTIAMIMGDNGVLNQATKASDETEIADEKEKVQLSATGALAKNNGGEITRDYLNEELTSYIGVEGTDYTLSESAPFTVTYVNSGRSYTVFENGEVNEVEIIEPDNIEDWGYIEEDGTITITNYNGNDTEIVIPNYINNIPVKKIENVSLRNNETILKQNGEIVRLGGTSTWFNGNKTVTKIVISEGIEIIGDNAFAGSTALEEIQLPQSLKTIGDDVFYQSTNLREITIPSNVESVGGYVFDLITNITVKVPFSEGNKPNNWDDDWNYSSSTYNIVVEYQ